MNPTVLVVLVVAAAVLAAPLPAIREVGLVTTASDHNPAFINILSFLGFVPTSLTAHLEVAFFKRHYMTSNDSSLHKKDASHADDGMIGALVIFSIVVVAVLVLIMIAGAVYSCIICRRNRRQNEERLRAEAVLNHHPQPVDIELDLIHARSTPHGPLASNTEIATTAPNTPERHDTEGREVTEAAIPKIYVTDTETMQASKPGGSNSELDIVASRTHVKESCPEPGIDHSTYPPTFHLAETQAVENNTTESSDLEDWFLTSTASKQAATAGC
ncbi:hypothetical protein CHU98_g7501 [Xylaria longipes]|nr:hypothetical protein CHU98_g7501 [Xylaria longipes]